jgi:hypothetical protein
MTGLLTTLYPGFFPVDVLDAAMPKTALPKLYLSTRTCQSCAKTAKQRSENQSWKNKLSDYIDLYIKNLTLFLADRTSWRLGTNDLSQKEVILLTHFVICRSP